MSFQKLRFEKVTLRDTIAEKLEEMILNEELKVGSKIPSELELAESFGVSRNILREALNILKERGIISGKAGDGTYVVRPEPVILTRMVGRLVQLSDLSYENIFDLRLSLEVLSAGLAAVHATEEDLMILDEIITDMKRSMLDSSKYSEVVFHFHLAVAAASKNPLIPSIMEPLQTALLEIFTGGYIEERGSKAELVDEHERILVLIRNKDRDGVERLMKEHILNSKRKVIK